jgi:hypothetical protein
VREHNTKEVSKPIGKEESRHIDLTELIARERIKTRESLRESIERIQENVVCELASSGWVRSTTYSRELVTTLGEIGLTVVKMRRGAKVFSPILDMLSIRRKRYSQELRMILADMAARLSYGDTRKQFMELTGVDVPKRTIHTFVQEVGGELDDALASR